MLGIQCWGGRDLGAAVRICSEGVIVNVIENSYHYLKLLSFKTVLFTRDDKCTLAKWIEMSAGPMIFKGRVGYRGWGVIPIANQFQFIPDNCHFW